VNVLVVDLVARVYSRSYFAMRLSARAMAGLLERTGKGACCNFGPPEVVVPVSLYFEATATVEIGEQQL
jgi:hypothetical protein